MTGSSGHERVEVVDADDRVVAVVTRAEMRARRLRHRTVAVVVTHPDGRLLVHRRSEEKDVWPGRWDVAAGGVVAVGESYTGAAHRELAEELGVSVAPGAIVAVGRAVYEDDDVAEIAHVFHVVHPGPFRFADGEVVEARFVDRDELAALRAAASFVPDSAAVVPLDDLLVPTLVGSRPVQELEFTVEPFVEGHPGPHVQAAVDAVRAVGAEVDFGPFGSSCRASAELMPEIVAAVTRAAFAHGATHVSLHVSDGSGT